MDADFPALREEPDVLAHVVQQHEQAPQIVFAAGKEPDVVDVTEIAEFHAAQLQLVKVRQDHLREQPRGERALGNAVVVEDALVGGCPRFQPPRQELAERGVATELAEKMTQDLMIEAVVACRQIEARRVGEAFGEGPARPVVERLVAFTPLAVEPSGVPPGVEMTEDLLEVAGRHPGVELLGDEVDGRLVDDLVLDTQERVGAENARGLGLVELVRLLRGVDPAL